MKQDARQQAEFVGEITRHQAEMRAFIISLMPGMDGASDVLQETNLVLWEKRAQFQPGTNFRAWAFAIVRLKVKMHRRKLMRIAKPLLDEDLAEELAELADESPEEIDERLSALDKCLGRLDQEHRRLVEHRYYSGGNLDEYSAKCGRSASSLAVTLCRVRAALKKCINHEMAVARHRP